MQENVDIVEQFRKCWDLASELAEKETKERFEGISYVIETIQEGGSRKGEPMKTRRVRVSKGQYKLDRRDVCLSWMIELFTLRYGGGNVE